MKDLTTDSIARHIVLLAAPIAAGAVTQIAYQLVDLYFVARLGVSATAGVNAAGNAVFIVTALATVLSTGASPLIGHAAGRKDRAAANLVFNQTIGIALGLGLTLMLLLNVLGGVYLQWVAADPATAMAGSQFVAWVSP